MKVTVFSMSRQVTASNGISIANFQNFKPGQSDWPGLDKVSS